MGILGDFFCFWEPTWLQNGGKLGIENALLLSLTEKGENPKSIYFPIEFEYFLDSGGPKLEQKLIKHR